MSNRNRAHQYIKEAGRFETAGNPDAAIESLQKAVALCAELIDSADQNDRIHGESSRRLAELLIESGRLPEAIQAYQEATDAFGRLGADAEAEKCAKEILAGV